MEISKKTLRNIFITVAALIVLHWILNETERFNSMMHVISSVVSPFLVGAGISFVLNVPMRAIENRMTGIKKQKLRRTVALVITLVVTVAIMVGILWLLVTQVIATAQSLAEKLPPFFEKAGNSIMELLNQNPQLKALVDKYAAPGTEGFTSVVQEVVDYVSSKIEPLVSGTIGAVSGVGTGIFNAFISIVFAVYCLVCKEDLARQGRKLLYSIFPENFSDEVIRVLRMANSAFSNFLSGQCIEVCILGTMFMIVMSILGMKFAPLISILIAVTAFIPVVGAFIGCAFGAFFILVEQGIVVALTFVVMFLLLQQFENNVIYPRVVGNSIGLPGMWVLLAVSIGGSVMGAAGMFLMIPVASVLYSLLREFTAVRLEKLDLDSAKLEPQPPELRSHLKDKHEKIRTKIKAKKEIRKAKKAQKGNDK